MNHLQKALEEPDCTSENIKLLLEQDISSINKMDVTGYGLLNQVLSNKNCSIEILKLLLDYGAEVQSVNHKGTSILSYALLLGHKVEVIELLLQRGADVNKINTKGRSPLCFALEYDNKAEIIKVLLDKGARITGCGYHGSVLECCVKGSFSDVEEFYILRADVLKLLLQKGADVKYFNRYGFTVLHPVLLMCRYEVGAVKLLLNHKDVDINARNRYGESLLHSAVGNDNCKLWVVKYLIDHGVKVDSADIHGNIPLHDAVSKRNCRLSIIKTLLLKGSHVNEKNKYGRTPMGYAIEANCNSDILNLLFAAGAQIEGGMDCGERSILQWSLDKFLRKKSMINLNRFKMLLQYTLLENPDFNTETLILGRRYRSRLRRFSSACVLELQVMQSVNVSPNITLQDFVSGCSRIQTDTAEYKQEFKDYVFNKLLKILANNAFRKYFAIILAKVGRSFMIDKLQEMSVYAQETSPEFPCVERIVILNYASACEVVKFISDIDLFRLIQTFYNSGNHTSCGPI